MLGALVGVITAGALWQLGFFAVAVLVVIWLARMQRNPANGINFIELVVDKDGRMDHVRVAYIVVLGVTTVGYVFFFMTVAMTAEGYALATVTYAGIWVASQGANRMLARDPAPTVNVTAPSASVSVQAGPKEGA